MSLCCSPCLVSIVRLPSLNLNLVTLNLADMYLINHLAMNNTIMARRIIHIESQQAHLGIHGLADGRVICLDSSRSIRKSPLSLKP